MEAYNIYKKNDQYNPVFTIIANDQQDEEIIEYEYGIYNSTISKKIENLPKDNDGNDLPRGIYYHETNIPISKESMILSRLESIDRSARICKIAAWFFIIGTILSIIIGIFVAIAGANHASGGY